LATPFIFKAENTAISLRKEGELGPKLKINFDIA
jgi:hypothetical protein